MWNHWAIRANHPYRPFTEFKFNHWVWNHLTHHFPHALSAVLMPNHMHLLLPKQTQALDREKLAGTQGAISKMLNTPRLWQPVSDPSLVPDRFHLKRNVRYIALNPCRRNLCKDPLEWVWSTYRDLFGAATHPWVSEANLVQELRESQHGFKVRFHAYVSGDPSVAIEGTPPPRAAAMPTRITQEPIRHILSASAAAMRLPCSQITDSRALRTLFIHFAHQQGWRQSRILTEITSMSRQGLHKNLKEQDPVGLAAAALCLGDVRLRNRGSDDHPIFAGTAEIVRASGHSIFVGDKRKAEDRMETDGLTPPPGWEL